MATSKEYYEYIIELLRSISGITSKKMMGEFLLYKDGVLFGGIYDNRLLIKKTKSNENKNLTLEIPYEGAKTMYLIDTDDITLISTLIENVVKDLNFGR